MTMSYVSTRGAAAPLGFSDVLLEGLATDGGLYVPERWPNLAGINARRPYAEVASEVMWPFVDGSMDRFDFDTIVGEAYATFETPPGSSPDVVPIVDLGDDLYLAELYWGPTLAFKDIALQLVGRLFAHQLAARHRRMMIVGATSGDTGSAAIDAVAGRDGIDIVMLHPLGRCSDVQRRQMTTVNASNVHNVAIDGTFDDCQDLVKSLFADESFRREVSLGAVNSINWARVMAQIVYYVTTSAAVQSRRASDEPVSFSVPTGNFGNVFAGYAAMRCGLDVNDLIVSSNHNDILTRFFTTATMEIQNVVPSLSPSMDIQVSSNLERLLFDLVGRRGSTLSEMMLEFRSEGRLTVPVEQLGMLTEHHRAGRFDDEQCLALMAELHRDRGLLIDPHTAVGIGVARELRRDGPVICLGTAHPAKFPDAVMAATGVHPQLPEHLADLFERPERYDTLANDPNVVKAYVRAALG